MPQDKDRVVQTRRLAEQLAREPVTLSAGHEEAILAFAHDRK